MPKLAKVGPEGEFKKQRVGRKRQGVWKWPEGSGLRLVSAGRWTQIVMTRSNTNVVRGYVNGRRVLTVEDTEGAEVLGAEKILHLHMDDEVTGYEETGGRIARLRIWDKPLGKRKIRNLGR